MKKLTSVFIALLLALSMQVLPAMAEDTLMVGVLSYLNLTESEYNEDFLSPEPMDMYTLQFDWLFDHGYLTDYIPGDNPLRLKVVFYDSMNAMLMALNTGEIDAIDDLPQTTAQYLCAQNDELVPLLLFDRERIDAEGGFAMDCFKAGGSGYSFLMKEENQTLCDDFNSAIADMKADGTLDRLIQTHIYAAIAGEEIAPIALDFAEGRETLRVAVTGSLPPMDYVAADGTFAGFNTAMLAEIGRRLDRNMEIVQVDSLGRATALATGNVDVVFWALSNPDEHIISEMPQGMTEEEFKAFLIENHPDYTEEQIGILARVGAVSDPETVFQEDIPEHTIVTDPYFVDALVCVGLKSTFIR